MSDKMRRLRDCLGQIKPEFFCLLAMLAIDFLYVTFDDNGTYALDNYMILPTMVFVGLLIGRKSWGNARRQFLSGGVFCLWFVLLQFLQIRRGLGSDPLGRER